MQNLSYIILVIFIILQIGDIITTIKALKTHTNVESNPIIKFIMGKIGIIPTLLLTKIIVIGILFSAMFFYPSTLLTILIGMLDILYCWVVWNNTKLS